MSEQPKTIYRIQKDTNNPYVQINKTALFEKGMSLKAKGLHCYMLSMKDDWIFYIDVMVKDLKEGEKAIRSALNELQKFGYARRYPERENGKIVRWVTTVYETPVDNLCSPCVSKPVSTSPFCTSRKPTSRKRSPNNNNRTINNNINKNNNVMEQDVNFEILLRKIKSRLTKMERFGQISNDDIERLADEIYFHIENRPATLSEDKSFNAAFKMLRDGRWSTPKKLSLVKCEDLETKSANEKLQERNELARTKLGKILAAQLRI